MLDESIFIIGLTLVKYSHLLAWFDTRPEYGATSEN